MSEERFGQDAVNMFQCEPDSSHLDRYDPVFYLANFHDYEQGISEPIVRGRLKSSIKFWSAIGAESEILSIIHDGYKLPFVNTPPAATFKNNKSAINYSDFVSEAVSDLLKKNLIVECSDKPCIVNPLSVSVQSSGKLRLILDLRYINKFLWKQKIKFDDWKVMEQLLTEGGYVFSFDIKQGYHHIDMHPDSIPYLGFAWEIDGVVKYFVFLVLPFGLTSAPFIFTKIVRVLVKLWRGEGVRICVFIDDGLGTKKSYTIAKMDAILVRESLARSGFIANVEKSHWDPSQELTWLGITVDLGAGTLKISQEREESIMSTLGFITHKLPFTSARKLANLTGKIMSTKLVLGDITQMKTRHLYRVIDARKAWDKTLSLNQHGWAISEIAYWRNNFRCLNVRKLNQHTVPTVTVASDASAYGLGAHTRVGSKEFIVHKSFSQKECGTSSTYREVFAILYALSALKNIHKGEAILWHTDNWAASKIVRKGSPKIELHEMAEKIFSLCKQYSIKLLVEWVPREFNKYADFLSKMVDHDDWQTTPAFFGYLENRWGPHTVDRFASSTNTKLKRFNSKFLCPNTEQVNAFAVSWSGENNYLAPPVTYVPKVLAHMSSCKAKGTIVVPYWPSAAFYPLVCKNSSKFEHFVKAWEVIPYRKGLVVQGENKKCFIGSAQFKSDLLVLRIEF